jgi:hypothetical protein
LILQSKIRGLKGRLLFVKVFLWFWVTVLVLFAIFVGSRMIGTRVVPSTGVIAAFAPRVADEAAQAYESGGPQEFAKTPGTYEFQCSVDCGIHHGSMKGQLIVDQ